jgi:tripartite-type tricarboxylate transporter receptor subunit TctC
MLNGRAWVASGHVASRPAAVLISQAHVRPSKLQAGLTVALRLAPRSSRLRRFVERLPGWGQVCQTEQGGTPIMHKFPRLAAAFVAGLASTNIAVAQTDWPNRSVTVIVPVNAGGGADPQVRAITDELRQLLGQPFVVEFRPGAAMMVGANVVAKSKPDGYTIMFSASTALVNAAVNPNAPYNSLEDLVPVTRTAGAATFISAHIKTPYNTYEQLIDFAKANPGRVNAAVAGIGSAGHYSASIVQGKTGALFNLVPYTGAGAILRIHLGGREREGEIHRSDVREAGAARPQCAGNRRDQVPRRL